MSRGISSQPLLWIVLAYSGLGPIAAISAEESLTAASPTARNFLVRDTQIEVRSGPGKQFYATSRLHRGDQVEVYRVDQEEWAAIRPPKGSFSWIEADTIEPINDSSSARIVRGGFRSRVGSEFSQARQVAYLTLREGDRVRLLDTGEARPDATWRKIAPVAGEFRWVPLSALDEVETPSDDSREGADAEPSESADSARNGAPMEVANNSENVDPIDEPSDELTDESNAESPLASAVVRAQWSYDLAPRTYDDKSSVEASISDQRNRFANNTSSIRQAFSDLLTVQGTEPIENPAPTEELMPPPLEGGALGPPTPSDPTIPAEISAPRTVGGSAGEVALQEVIRVSAELSRTVANAEPSQWNLDPLAARARAVVDADGPAEVRRMAQDLIARIAQFADLQRRHRQLAAANDSSQKPSPGNGGSSTPTGSAGNLASLPDRQVDITRYDGYGWLMPVVTKRPNLPRYVLTDNQGNILQFVSPRPGLNLSRYEKRRVGIYGERDFLPSVSQPHLVAERIVTMDRLR